MPHFEKPRHKNFIQTPSIRPIPLVMCRQLKRDLKGKKNMKREDGFNFDREFMSYDDVERIVRRARAKRDAALGRAIRSVVLTIAGGYGRLIRAIEEALQLRALAMLDDRQLAALGLDRLNLPAFVYGWKSAEPTLVEPVVVTSDIEASPIRPDSIAA